MICCASSLSLEKSNRLLAKAAGKKPRLAPCETCCHHFPSDSPSNVSQSRTNLSAFFFLVDFLSITRLVYVPNHLRCFVARFRAFSFDSITFDCDYESFFTMRQFAILALLTLLLSSFAAADALDSALNLFRRQSSNETSIVSVAPSSTTTEIQSQSQQSSVPPSVVGVTSTFTQPTSSQATSAEVSTVFSTSTSTRTQDGSTVAVVTSSAVSTSSASLTQITTSATQEVTTTYTSVTDGSTVTGTRTSSTVVAQTTSVDPTTLSNHGSGSSGLSSSTKATIGGVVGGVGGALLLGALAYTAWRIWGKKKNLHDDDLYDPNIAQDKLSTSTATGSTPFQSNLEQYHQPGPVTNSTNF